MLQTYLPARQRCVIASSNIEMKKFIRQICNINISIRQLNEVLLEIYLAIWLLSEKLNNGIGYKRIQFVKI